LKKLKSQVTEKWSNNFFDSSKGRRARVSLRLK
jgi:hypothetical protein